MIDTKYITPIVVEFTLYKNNRKDNQFLSALKNSTNLFTLPKDPKVFMLTRIEMEALINTRYRESINDIKNSPSEDLYKNISSPYFVDNLLTHFTKVQYFRVVVSNSVNYTRLNTVPEIPVISFNHRIVYAKLDLSKALDKENNVKVKHLLQESGILSKSKIHKSPYLLININDMFSIFGSKESEQEYFSEYFNETINTVLKVISPKLEKDNTNILLMLEN